MTQKIYIVILFLMGFGVCLASESRIELVTFKSPSLGISKRFNIYLPKDYDENTFEYYPVVYLFRGHEQEWVNPEQDVSRGGRGIKEVADQLYETGLIGKMILVMPGMMSANWAINGLAINMLHVELASDTSGIGSGQFQDFIIYDLISYVDSHYRTLPSGSHRGTDGFSAGGFPALTLIAKFPELFCSSGSYDGNLGGYLDFDDPNSPGPLDDELLTHPILNPHFGLPPRDVEYMKQFNPANHIYYADSTKLELLRSSQFLIHSAQSSLEDNIQYIVDLMADRGIVNMYEEILLRPGASHNWYFADEHIIKTLPLHWEKLQNPDEMRNTFPLKIITPVAGSEVSGSVEIKWSLGKSFMNCITMLAYSRDEGKNWQAIATFTSNNTSYIWNTESVEDGTRYLLRVIVFNNTDYAVSKTVDRFTVNNAGNAIPDIELLSFKKGKQISGEYLIPWFADDAEGDLLTFSMKYSPDGGMTWHSLFSNLQNTSEYLWNTVLEANSTNYRLVLHCSDGEAEVTDTSDVIIIFNERSVIDPSNINHVAGNSGAIVTAQVVNFDELTNHSYRITFNDSLLDYKVYNVFDIEKGLQVIHNANQLDGETEGPLFGGIRLLIKDINPAIIDVENTGWTVGSSNLRFNIFIPTLHLGTEDVKGYPYPADYKIKIFDRVVDTSSTIFGAPENLMKFWVWNLTEDRKNDIIFIDQDKDQTISRLNQIYILEPDPADEPKLTWSILFMSSDMDSVTHPGDEFVFKTLKPITSKDVYEFKGQWVSVNEDDFVQYPGDLALFPNYPNPFNSWTTISYYLREPGWTKVTIYNLLGQQVTTLLDSEQRSGHHSIKWDGKNKQGTLSGSGVYFYQIQTGNKVIVRKMVLMH